MKKKNIKNAESFNELLDIKYGKVGTADRDKFEEKAQHFVINTLVKKIRKRT